VSDPLSDTELEILRILWLEHPLKPAEIEEQFAWPIDNGTLRSTLSVLMSKGKVTRRKVGKAFVYSPVVERPSLLKSLTERLSKILTGGSTAELVMELVRAEKFSPEQIEELRRLAEQKAEAQPPATRKGRSS
jgi:predicted transcriptional regulator